MTLDRCSVDPGHCPRGAADSSCARSDGVVVYARAADAAANERLRTAGDWGNACRLRDLLATESASGLCETKACVPYSAVPSSRRSLPQALIFETLGRILSYILALYAQNPGPVWREAIDRPRRGKRAPMRIDQLERHNRVRCAPDPAGLSGGWPVRLHGDACINILGVCPARGRRHAVIGR